MEQKRTGLFYIFTLAKGDRGKLGIGMTLTIIFAISIHKKLRQVENSVSRSASPVIK